jgi:hypothetical protein
MPPHENNQAGLSRSVCLSQGRPYEPVERRAFESHGLIRLFAGACEPFRDRAAAYRTV